MAATIAFFRLRAGKYLLSNKKLALFCGYTTINSSAALLIAPERAGDLLVERLEEILQRVCGHRFR